MEKHRAPWRLIRSVGVGSAPPWSRGLSACSLLGRPDSYWRECWPHVLFWANPWQLYLPWVLKRIKNKVSHSWSSAHLTDFYLHSKNVLNIPFRQALDNLCSIVDLRQACFCLLPLGNTWQCLETVLVVARGWVFWRLVGGDKACCSTPYSAQDSTHDRELCSSKCH